MKHKSYSIPKLFQNYGSVKEKNSCLVKFWFTSPSFDIVQDQSFGGVFKVFLKFFKNSQENTCAWVSFKIKF